MLGAGLRWPDEPVRAKGAAHLVPPDRRRRSRSYHPPGTSHVVTHIITRVASINVNGVQLHYEERGSGAPVLLLHGGTGIGADWELIFPSAPDGFRTIIPDL